MSVLFPGVLRGQELVGMTVHSGESFYVHSAENVSIFSNLGNSGTIGTRPGSVINFRGLRWSNRAGSRIADESTDGTGGIGGLIRFSSVNGSLQFLENQGNSQTTGGIPNLAIANSGNLMLEGSDLIVRRNLTFERGHLLLNNRNAILSQSATISGFDQNRFVVTGTGTNGGYLVRRVSGAQPADLIFPVGTGTGNYTPASLSYSGTSQDLKVRVFDNVYDRAFFGMPDNSNYVPRTWVVSFSTTDPSARISINAQHNASDEGADFTAKRSESYLSRYLPSTDVWDSSNSTGVSPGNLSSGGAIANAYLNTRSGITGLATNEYFAKSIISTSSIAGLRIPEGISPNNDGLNEKFIIQNLRATDKVRLEIYNRWQSLVFKDLNYKNTFDGTGNQKGLVNNILPDGTYYYILNINGEKPITGFILINR